MDDPERHHRSSGNSEFWARANLQSSRCPNAMRNAGWNSPQKPIPEPNGSAKKKPSASYTDRLPAQLESDSPSSFATYAVEVLNSDGRGAGLSNRVKARCSVLRLRRRTSRQT